MSNPLIDKDWNDRSFTWKEEHLQAAVCQKLSPLRDNKILDFEGDMNAGKRGKRAQQLAKLTGMRAGSPDLRIYLAGGMLLSVEFKTTDNYLSAAQKMVHNLRRELGFDVRVIKCRTPMQAVNELGVMLGEHGVFYDGTV